MPRVIEAVYIPSGHRCGQPRADPRRPELLKEVAESDEFLPSDGDAVRGDEPRDVWTGAGGAIVRELIAGADEEESLAAAPPLLRGEDVMAVFALLPGPEVGQLPRQAREAQARPRRHLGRGAGVTAPRRGCGA